VIVVRGLTTNHAPQADDRRIPSGGGQLARHQWDLERARYPRHVDPLIGNPVPRQRIPAADHERLGDERIESPGNDREPALGVVKSPL